MPSFTSVHKLNQWYLHPVTARGFNKRWLFHKGAWFCGTGEVKLSRWKCSNLQLVWEEKHFGHIDHIAASFHSFPGEAAKVHGYKWREDLEFSLSLLKSRAPMGSEESVMLPGQASCRTGIFFVPEKNTSRQRTFWDRLNQKYFWFPNSFHIYAKLASHSLVLFLGTGNRDTANQHGWFLL